MKKRVMFLVLSLCILMLAGGCNNKDKVKDNDNDNKVEGTEKDSTVTTDTTDGDALGKGKYELKDHIKLGQYKGIEVTVEVLEVTDEDIEAVIQEDLLQNTTKEEVTGKAVENGDIVNIDYEGLKDGVAFDNGTDTGYDLEIGSNSFIPGFEEQLIGANTGDKLDLDVTFPAVYPNSPEMAGQAVVFKVTVNAIKKTVVPELSEEFAKEIMGYETIALYREAIREMLKLENEEAMEMNKIYSVMDTIVENSEISSLPQSLLDYYKKDRVNYYTQYAAMYGMELAGFLAVIQMTEASLEAEALQYADAMSTQELVLKAIIKAEKIAITEEEFQAELSKLALQYNYASGEELLADANEELLKENMLFQKAIDFVIAEAIVL